MVLQLRVASTTALDANGVRQMLVSMNVPSINTYNVKVARHWVVVVFGASQPHGAGHERDAQRGRRV